MRDKVKGGEKDRGSKKEREKDSKKVTEKKIESSDKQITLSDDKAKSGPRDSSKKRQQTKFKRTEKNSSSSSDIKSPTSPPPLAVKPKSSNKTKAPTSPRTPATPPENRVKVSERSEPSATEEKVAFEPNSAVTRDHVKHDGGEADATEPRVASNRSGVPETPESPPAQHQAKQPQKVESDLSSGEEFPESTLGSPLSPRAMARDEGKEKNQRKVERDMEEKTAKTGETETVKFRMKFSQTRTFKQRSGVSSPPTAPWSPAGGSSPLQSQHTSPPHSHSSPRAPSTSAAVTHNSPPPPARLSGEESEEGSRKSKKLPRCYQIEEERLREKQREVNEARQTKPHPPPSTPSPPPAYASHRRRPHSPPQPEYDRRWRQRGRHFSPTHQPGPRRYSRSPPPGYPQSLPPPHSGGRSPYSSSPPPPRPRTPIQRPRDRGAPRHCYESPPYDMSRGKHSRRGSSPVRHMSPSPPPSRTRSPGGPGRRYPRRYSRTPSPPRRSPLRRKEPTPSPGSSRSSPRYTEERLEARKYAKKSTHPGYSRSPSPKPKRRDAPPREEYPDPKRRRMEDTRAKSPTSGPPAPKDDQNKAVRTEKSQQSPYQPTGGSSDRRAAAHHTSSKDTQHRYMQGSTQSGANRSAHHQTTQNKTPSPMSLAAPQTVGSNTASLNQPPSQQVQQPTDNLLDLLR